ncbi:hypothetical protein [Dethiosulfatarculus sandiegensis]|uniref:Lipoprotein n=1 Tax=Dethiosulfatarculus sandiegensis TaxID=1429043 RepID=A0A0D2GGK3_9BACT|nr:hypothetical protein [Dethiosulfatarculus sandiegensis]KIX14007.1 hypothetical protein X474_13075 [Dethiosulfatarculus sandiegensis]
MKLKAVIILLAIACLCLSACASKNETADARPTHYCPEGFSKYGIPPLPLVEEDYVSSIDYWYFMRTEDLLSSIEKERIEKRRQRELIAEWIPDALEAIMRYLKNNTPEGLPIEWSTCQAILYDADPKLIDVTQLTEALKNRISAYNALQKHKKKDKLKNFLEEKIKQQDKNKQELQI